jgi:hypothetical protein
MESLGVYLFAGAFCFLASRLGRFSKFDLSRQSNTNMAYYWLTPPSRAVFFLSVLLSVLALLVRYAHIAIPVVSQYSFETLLMAFLLLLAGNLFRGF